MHKIFVHAQKYISASAYTSVCCHRRTFLERIQPMSNVHLPVSVYQRMSDFVHTLAYASAIRNSVTGLLAITVMPTLTAVKQYVDPHPTGWGGGRHNYLG